MPMYNKDQLIEEVKKQTEIGKIYVKMTMNFLKWIGHGMKDGSYRMMEDKDITKDMIDITLARLEEMPENLVVGML